MARAAKRLVELTEQVDRNLHRNIRHYMRLNEMSARMLGMELGLARTTVNDRLSGLYEFRPDELYYMAERFGVTVYDLIADAPPDPPDPEDGE